MWFKKKKKITPTVYTEEVCPRCGEKKKRRFGDGDYIYKIGSNCKKCSELTMIIAIYGEYPMEKQKKSQEF
jgi:ribosomal protein L37AE/L43A